MLRIQPSVADDDRNGTLTLTAEGMPACVVPVPGADAPRRHVQIWGDVVIARDAPAQATAWCCSVIGRAAHLVRLGSDSHRALKEKYAGDLPYADREVAFTDGAPLMMLGLPSIAALEAKVAEGGEAVALPQRRFRANIWLDGLAPYEEDTWRAIRIGDVAIDLGDPCVRCVLTTVNPDTLERSAEPLRTLATYRRWGGGVIFGMNATHAAPGVVRVGDAVQVERLR